MFTMLIASAILQSAEWPQGNNRTCLLGSPPVYVLYDPPKSKDWIELALRRNGIKVSDQPNDAGISLIIEDRPPVPPARVEFSGAGTLRVYAREWLYRPNKPGSAILQRVRCTTWRWTQTANFGTAVYFDEGDRRKEIGNALEEFCNDYLAANPK